MPLDWNKPTDRRTGKKRFWDKLSLPENMKPGGLREQCIKFPYIARQTFAKAGDPQAGDFILQEDVDPSNPPPVAAIPMEVEFRVFDPDIPSREKMVVLVLRQAGSKAETPDPDQVWQCTYFPY
jgi:hypothetical protein